jgi:hypothetical protein
MQACEEILQHPPKASRQSKGDTTFKKPLHSCLLKGKCGVLK